MAPFSLFAAFAIWRFYVTCYTLPRPWLEPLMEDIADFVKAAWRKIRPCPRRGRTMKTIGWLLSNMILLRFVTILLRHFGLRRVTDRL